MFDISLWEILLIAIVIVLVVKPQHLPSVARNIGRWFRYFKNLFSSVSTEINKQIQIDAEQETREKRQQSDVPDED